MNVVFGEFTGKEFCELKEKSGMKPRFEDKANIALQNSLFKVGIRNDDGELVAFGRVVGDGATTFSVNDIMVAKQYQRQGFGTAIMKHIDEYLNSVVSISSFTSLNADPPADKLYRKFGFHYLEENGAIAMFRPVENK